VTLMLKLNLMISDEVVVKIAIAIKNLVLSPILKASQYAVLLPIILSCCESLAFIPASRKCLREDDAFIKNMKSEFNSVFYIILPVFNVLLYINEINADLAHDYITCSIVDSFLVLIGYCATIKFPPKLSDATSLEGTRTTPFISVTPVNISRATIKNEADDITEGRFVLGPTLPQIVAPTTPPRKKM
jgi:hypothetical protein